MSRKMYLGGAVIVVVIAIIIIGILLGKQSVTDESSGWPATKVALAVVTRADAPRAFFAVGELEAANQVNVAAETSGRITAIAFTSGQLVQGGQILVQLNDAPEQAERIRLRAQLRNAERMLERARTLVAQKVGTQEQLDEAVAVHDMAQGDLQRIEAVIAQKVIRAPFAGIVGIRRVHQGQHLSAGEVVASLVDASSMHVNFALDEQARPQLQVGQTVALRIDAWPERTFTARLSAIDPLIDSARMIQLQASLPNPEGLLQAGMYASVEVHQQGQAPVLAVPETAVTYTSYGKTVFVVVEDDRQMLTVRRVAVETGERWEGRVEISAGLEEGDRVVASGQLKLSDGMAVEPVAADTLYGADAAAAGGEHQP